jgi:hypothetical protein
MTKQETYRPARRAFRRLTLLAVLGASLAALTAFAAPARAQVVLSTNRLLFLCAAGQECPAQTVALTNTGKTTVKMYSIVLSGSGEFLVTNTCDDQLSPGETCSISVGVTDSQAGTFTGVLAINDSAPNSPQRVFLKAIVKSGS